MEGLGQADFATASMETEASQATNTTITIFMRETRIAKKKLIGVVKKNKAEHRDIFLKAQEAFRETVIKLLDEALAAAREKKQIPLIRIARLVQPQDHTVDYDRALLMLEMSEDDTITIDEHTFRNLVLDEWEWSRAWAVSNSTYTQSPKFGKYLGEE